MAVPRRHSTPHVGRGPVHNAEIAAAFNEIADILEIEGANPFRIRAYRNAARVVSGLPAEAGVMLARGDDLSELPGIGKDLAQKIANLAATGTTPLLGMLRKELPPTLTELLRLPGLGPKRVKLLHDELDIETLPQLHRALKDGCVSRLPGFGERMTQRLLQAVEARAATPERMKLATATQYAEPLLAYLRDLPGVDKVAAAGSYRRARETVGDLDFVVTATRPAAVVEGFTRYAEVARIVARGPTRGTVTLRSGLQVDIRVVPPESYGAALVYFTGSKAHSIAIRRLAQQYGLKMNEYGVFQDDRRVAGDTEESVYRAIGLPLIPPELREDRGEIDAARGGRLPDLVTLEDMRGDLHVHTTATDGRNTLREMALAAKERGYDYIAITEHSRRLTVAHGLDAAQLNRQIAEIDSLNRTGIGIAILKGIEVDILEDGTLDLPDAVLSRLDLIIGAVHSKFDLTRDRQTARILRGLDNPQMTMLAHPTGRLIGEREPYDVDMAAILGKARERGRFLELNAHPDRLDLLDTHCRAAKEVGVLVSINTDAHSVAEYANMRFGVGQARRGWLERGDVLNTRPLSQLRRLLATAKGR
jgi:DNA polymerase (family 10)